MQPMAGVIKWTQGPLSRLALLGLISSLLPCAGAETNQALPTLTRMIQVRNLTAEEAARAYPVSVEGVITYSEPDWQGVFFQDDTAGLLVRFPAGEPPPKTGQRLLLRGVSGSDGHAPMILNPVATTLESAPSPKARSVTLAQMLTGQEDSQLVEARGIVRTVAVSQNGFTLKVANEDGRFEVRIPGAGTADPPRHLVDAEVQFQGVAGTLYNEQRQIIGACLFVPSIEQARVLRAGPAGWDQIPSQAVGQLLRFDPQLPRGHRTRVRGTVTARTPDGLLFLQDERATVRVRTASRNTSPVGTSVEAAGFPVVSDQRPMLEDAELREVERQAAPPVHRLDPQDLPPSLDGRLVSLRGRLWQNWVLTGAEHLLVLQVSNRVFFATLPVGTTAELPPDYKIGSILQLTGVFWPRRNEGRELTTPQILLRAPADIVLISAPSWWTAGRTLIVLAVLLGALILGAFWVGALRRQVSAKTRQIREYARERELLLERRFSDLVENANDLIFTLDHTGRFSSFNKAGQEATGYSRDEVLQMNLVQVIAPEHQELARELLQPRNGGGTHCLEWVSKSGQRRLLEVSARSLRGNNELQVIQCIGRDVTERERAKQALAHERDVLEAFMDNTPDRVYFKDRASRFVRCSRSLAEFFRLAKASDAAGKTDFDFFTKEHAQPAFDDEQRIIRTGQAITGLVEKETWPDGHVTWSLTSKMPWRNEHGETIGIFGVSKDITDLKSTEAALAHERDLLAAFLENIPDAVYFKDHDSRFVRCSRSLAKHVGLPSSAGAIGKTDFDFFGKEHAQPAYEDEQRIIHTGQPMVGAVEKETWPDGRITWALTTKMPWRNEQGKIIGTFGISKNITPLKQAEEEVERTHRQLLTVSRQAGMAEVATSVLHNVGNVLNSVNVSANLLAEKLQQTRLVNLPRAASLLLEHSAEPAFLCHDERGRQLPAYLQQLAHHLLAEREQMLQELQSLLSHIAHIKDIVMMQQSYARIAGVTEKVKVSDLVEDALRLNDAALSRNDIQVSRQFEVDPEILVDKHRVLQILVNLLRNAKYACEEGSASDKRLTVRLSAPAADRVAIGVVDNGIGIAPENRSRIFTQGFTTRREGHGFGLHSSANAAAEIGGTLSFFSAGPEQGAAFTLELPLTPPKRD